MEDLILILAGIFAVGMIILMLKYAKFIHTQPRIDADRRKIKKETDSYQNENSKHKQ